MQSPQPTADSIRREMDAIRTNLHVDMDRLVVNARHLTNWKHYVRSFPWASVGVAAALGYIAVPRKLEIRSPDREALEQLAKDNRLVVQHAPKGEERRGVLMSAANLLGNMLLRAGIAYAGQQAGRIFGEHASKDESHQPVTES